MNIAIIVAAGSGSRFGSDIPKQFTPLAGKPIVLHTLQKFEDCGDVDEIVLVLSEEGSHTFNEIADRGQFSKLRSIVIGGNTRAESVKNALDSLDASDLDIVAVHDGARPLVTPSEISETVGAAASGGAACLVAEVTDTMKRVSGGNIVDTVPRNELRRALTPQAFRYELIKRAFEGADLTSEVTDECYLVEKLGQSIKYVEGSSRNIKITRAEDLQLAEMLLQQEK